MNVLEAYDAVVCDLDGVVYRGDAAVEYAVESLQACPLPVVFATNNASRSPSAVAQHLRELGLTLDVTQVVTSSQAGAQVLGERVPPGSKVLAVGGVGVREALSDSGFDVVNSFGDEPVAVLQGYDRSVTAADLAEAAYAIEAGAVWIATNTDLSLPTAFGLAPGNGAMVAAVQAAVGRGPDAVAGKPEPPLYLLCAQRLGVPPARVLAVGDRLETDIEGARRAGMGSLLVLTGVHSADDAARAPAIRTPEWIADDLRVLVPN